MQALEGKRAVVTGASRGIGRAVAIKLAAQGARVAVNYNASADKAQAVVDEIEQASGTAVAVRASTADVAQIMALMEAAVEQLGGPLDIVVSNAGIEHFGALEDVTEADFDATFAVNTRGQFFVVQQGAKHMGAGGRIICTASISGRMGVARHAVYAASKAAIEGMVRSLAVELGPRGITVNAIVPGGVNTDMAMEHGRAYGGDFSHAPLSAEEVAGALTSVTPLARGAVPEDIANAIALLVSPDAEWISGQAIVATGGA